MRERVDDVHSAVGLLDDAQTRVDWYDALRRVARLPSSPGLVAGRIVRLLRDAGAIDAERAAIELSLVLSGRWPMSCVNPTVLAGSSLKRWQPVSMERGPNS